MLTSTKGHPMPKRSHIPLKKWAADLYQIAAAAQKTGPRVFALSILRYASLPYRPKGGKDPFNEAQRFHLDGWHFEYMNRSTKRDFTTPMIVQAYQDLLAEWYGEKEPPTNG